MDRTYFPKKNAEVTRLIAQARLLGYTPSEPTDFETDTWYSVTVAWDRKGNITKFEKHRL